MNRLRIERDADVINRRKELDRIERELDKAIQAILDGVPGAKLKNKIGGLEAQKSELLELVSGSKEPVPLLHPNMAAIYRQRISALCESLGDEDRKVEAVEVLRTLVDQVALVPENGELSIVLRGDLAAILTFAANKKRPDFLSEAGLLGDLISPVSVVAGTGFEPASGIWKRPLVARRPRTGHHHSQLAPRPATSGSVIGISVDHVAEWVQEPGWSRAASARWVQWMGTTHLQRAA